MSLAHENPSEAPSKPVKFAPMYVPRKYKVAIGILLLSLVIVCLMSLQWANFLVLQNSQLSSHSSSLSNDLSDLNKIVRLEKSQILASNQAINWTSGTSTLPLDWSCQCFQYSGFLRINWTSATDLSFRVFQFDLNFTTPSMAVANVSVPISSEEPFVASFVMTNCPVQGGCTAIYSAVYHY